MTVGFVRLRDLSDGWVFNVSRFCSFMRFQRQLVLFRLQNFNYICFNRL